MKMIRIKLAAQIRSKRHPNDVLWRSPNRASADPSPAGTDAALAGLSHLALQVVLQPDFSDEFQLRLEKIDVFFSIVKNALQQIA